MMWLLEQRGDGVVEGVAVRLLEQRGDGVVEGVAVRLLEQGDVVLWSDVAGCQSKAVNERSQR